MAFPDFDVSCRSAAWYKLFPDFVSTFVHRFLERVAQCQRHPVPSCELTKQA